MRAVGLGLGDVSGVGDAVGDSTGVGDGLGVGLVTGVGVGLTSGEAVACWLVRVQPANSKINPATATAEAPPLLTFPSRTLLRRKLYWQFGNWHTKFDQIANVTSPTARGRS